MRSDQRPDTRNRFNSDPTHKEPSMLANRTYRVTASAVRTITPGHGLRAAGIALLVTILTTMPINPSPLAAQDLTQNGSVFESTLLEPGQRTAEVSTDELRQVLRDGSAVVFDSRPHIEYSVSHIPGALNVA